MTKYISFVTILCVGIAIISITPKTHPMVLRKSASGTGLLELLLNRKYSLLNMIKVIQIFDHDLPVCSRSTCC